MFDSGDWRPILDCADLLRVHFDTFLRDVVAKVGNSLLLKETFPFVGIDLSVAHPLEDFSKVLVMFFSGFAVDSQIINVDYHEF